MTPIQRSRRVAPLFLTAAIVAVTVTSCTGQGTSAGSASASPDAVGTQKTPDVTPSSASPTSTSSPVPTFGPSSTVILKSERAASGAGYVKKFEIKAPVKTSFKIGKGGLNNAPQAVACTTNGEAGGSVSYEVTCPEHPGDDTLYSIITYEDFDYTFAKPLPEG
ncbi:hypothetical protein [Arthrobacter woluwensis]|uniref:hypothetical protein n=1 Tax=Arthrobacter woluwensis TaxID=156980 RepID=UPI0011A5D0AD|nr:hypothetical protein [Arthrobacter woluwensis]